ncbi:MAG: hypothetical protein H6813_06475 [Phycisphaeraceae bacterium]|nr:hypothetical protein [Phycisphaeraceae bacterium]MCB9848117.1 hypothetical protein [Phycisphaeraceae bacterium]
MIKRLVNSAFVGATALAGLMAIGLAGATASAQVTIEITNPGIAGPEPRGPMCDDAPVCVLLTDDPLIVPIDSTGQPVSAWRCTFSAYSPCGPDRATLLQIIVDNIIQSEIDSDLGDINSPTNLDIVGTVLNDGAVPGQTLNFVMRMTDLSSIAITNCPVTLVAQCASNPICTVPSEPIEVSPYGDSLNLNVITREGGCSPLPTTLRTEVFDHNNNSVIGLVSGGITGPTPINVITGINLAPGEQVTWRVVVTDLNGDLMTECPFDIRGCDRPVICSLDGDESYMSGPMRVYDVEPGDTLEVFEVCAESACGGPARVEMFARPPFMEPAGHRKGNDGEPSCISTKADDVVESGFAEGTYWAKFHCEDLLTGDLSELKVGFHYTDPGPDPDPAAVCAEDESAPSNDGFDSATPIDAGVCADAGGVGIFGTLDVPIVINGDVDFYRIDGLTPGTIYTATIVAGSDGQQRYTDTMLGWFAAAGVLVTSDDNGGPRGVFSAIEFIADDSGAATIAVTGHGDDNFDGLMDPSMPYNEYGFGDYMLLVHGLAPDLGDIPLERQADLNGDGVVDTGDLGILIGLFGATN